METFSEAAEDSFPLPTDFESAVKEVTQLREAYRETTAKLGEYVLENHYLKTMTKELREENARIRIEFGKV